MMKIIATIIVVLGVTGLGTAWAAGADAKSAYAPVIRCYNVAPTDLKALSDAAGGEGLKLTDAAAGEPMGTPAIVLWEANHSAEPDAARVEEIGEYVRKGGRLVLTLDALPGVGAWRFKSLCPTTAWRTLLEAAHRRGGDGSAVDAAAWDPEMFPAAAGQALHLPYFHALRPFDTAERGMQRYERFDRGDGYLNLHHAAGDADFTRPLLNRDWQMRIRGGDMGASGLLITGRYGAGRVAVFASSATAANAAVWGPLLKWLDTERPTQPIEAAGKPAITLNSTRIDAANRALIVELSNDGDAPAKTEVIGRVLTWEHALIGDVLQTVGIAAKSNATISLPLPNVDATQYQALDAKDAFIVRLGILGNQGSTLLAEREEAVDFRPATRVTVALDNLRQIQYPFQDVPGENAQDRAMPNRMGEPVMAYAYPPGTEVNVTASVSNGLVNLAPLATITDETQPGNPSVVALNDQVQPPGGPIDGITAYGVWEGKADVDNTLLFIFAQPVHISQLVITGNPADSRSGNCNPGDVMIQADGKQVADVKDFDAQLAAQACAVHVHFDTVAATKVVVRIPWIATLADGKKRGAPRIGQIEIHGFAGDAPPAVQGKLTLTLNDALAPSQRVLSEQDVTLQPAEEKQIAFKIPAEAITTDASAARFFRVQAQFVANDNAVATAASPFMTIQPTNPLKPIHDIHPGNGAGLNFIVTRGFRTAMPLGTGTRDAPGSWGTPDDNVYAYERQLKQTGGGTHGTAKQFFVTENDFRHYAAPWSIFPNGQVFFDVATPNLLARAQQNRNWNNSDIVQFGCGDRWDTGPAASLLYSWPELVAFDAFLRSQQLPGLAGGTRAQVVHEIQAKYDNRYSAWHMARYADTIKTLHDAFAAAGKRLIISGQGTPLVPNQYQQALAETVQGMSDDTTWGMGNEDVPETTGRQMATLAFNPVWRMCEVLVWGYDSAIMNNPHWHIAVGTTESSRRHYADPGWRGFIDPQGQYRLTCMYGYGMNANVSCCMSLNDWQESWRMQERLSLITPDAPLGAGMVIGNDRWNEPEHATFSGGGMGGSPADSITNGVAHVFSTLCNLRIPVSFSTNVAALANWKANTPIIVLNLNELSDAEIKTLQTLRERGVRMIGFSGGEAISPAAAAIFGNAPNGTVLGKPVLATATTLLINAPYQSVTPNDLQSIAGLMRDTLATDLQLPAGTSGYGFVRGKQRFVVVEDWREQGRDLAIKLRATPGTTAASGVNVNEHVSLPVARDGEDWVIHFPTRPGDGTLLCVEEK